MALNLRTIGSHWLSDNMVAIAPMDLVTLARATQQTLHSRNTKWPQNKDKIRKHKYMLHTNIHTNMYAGTHGQTHIHTLACTSTP